MKLSGVILRGTRAAQPAATTVDVGTLYAVTDENTVERSNATTWDTYVAGNAAPQVLAIACSDETTAITTGSAKVTFHWPMTGAIEEIWAGLSTVQTSGSVVTIDVNDGVTTMLSTKVTIDNSEETSLTAATAAVLSDTSVTKGGKATIDVDQVGDGTAKGLKVYIRIVPT